MAKFKRVPIEVPVSQLGPLNISCCSTKCEDNLHCFKTNKKIAQKFGDHGVCRTCGTKLIDWERIHKNDILDAKFIFNSMKKELIRHVYWHIKIEEKDLKKGLNKGKAEIRIEAAKRISTVIGIPAPYKGGFTPYQGNVIYYAQHATATCCRKCMEYWHNIPQGAKLNNEQVEYCVNLMMLYIEERMPNIN